MSYYPLYYQIDSGLNLAKAPVIMTSASGSVASFPDGAADLPVQRLMVGINPVQDLHGYDNPWPAGGGKNLFNYEGLELGGIDETGADDDTATTDSRTGHINVTAESSYTLSGLSDSVTAFYYDEDGVLISDETVGNETITTPEGAATVRFAGTTANFTSTTQLESGTSATTFAPYSNICPITGHTGVKLTNDPKYGGNIRWNQLFPKTSDSLESVYYKLVGNNDGSVTVTVKTSDSISEFGNPLSGLGGKIIGHKYIILSGNPTVKLMIKQAPWPSGDAIFTAVSSSGSNISLKYPANSQGVYTLYPLFADLTEMFGAGNEPATVAEFKALFPKDYYPYTETPVETCVSAVNGDPYIHYPITFPVEAGTVYGGELTINEDGTGELVVDRKTITLDENSSIVASGSYQRYQIIANDFTAPATSIIADIKASFLKPTTNDVITSHDWVICGADKNSHVIRFRFTSDYTSVQTIKDYLENNPLQVVYPLNEPITTTLTAPQVRTLLGVNNIWADTGDTEATYRADTKLYIEQLTKPDEYDMIADSNITSGKFFMVGNRLFLSTAAIEQGAAIVPGTNCTEMSLADALNTINT